MKTWLSALSLLSLALAGCDSHPYHLPPGQVQKATGYNPASGKWKPGASYGPLDAHPGRGRGGW